MLLLSYDEAVAGWEDVNVNPAGVTARNFKHFKSFWDSYSGVVEDKETLLAVIARELKADKQCRYYRPFGDFKDFSGANVTRQVVYEAFTERALEPLVDKTSIIDIILTFGIRNDITVKGVRTLSTRELLEAFSIMLYRTTAGVVMEAQVLSEMKVIFEQLTEDLTVTPAPSFMEGDDVDGIIKVKESGENLLFFSVKNLRALSRSTIKNKRSKGKTKPSFYIGYESENAVKMKALDKDGNQINFLEVLKLAEAR